MKKKFTYNGKEFTMMVEFNHFVEKTPNGSRFHLLMVQGLNYGRTYKVENDKIKQAYEDAVSDIKIFVDDLPKDPAILLFEELGFAF